MLDIKSQLADALQRSGMATDESLIYIELTKKPATHLQLSRELALTGQRYIDLLLTLNSGA